MSTSASGSMRTTAQLAQTFGLTSSGPSVAIHGIALDNRVVKESDLFAALPGAHVHGAVFAPKAIAAGAVAILTDPAGASQLADVDVPVLVAANLRAVLGPISAWVYGNPSASLRTFAVTGTNGKTTTTYILEEILRQLGHLTGLIGTIELRVGHDSLPAHLTTPESPALQSLLAKMVDAGASDLAMEVSSHALALHRVDGIRYSMAGFTNLTPDHLDFHGGIENYFRAKAALFTPEHSERGVVLIDDEWGVRMAQQAQVPVTTVTTRTDRPGATWRVELVGRHAGHNEFSLTNADGRSLTTAVWMPGAFNVANAAVALTMLLEAGVPVEELQNALAGGIRPHVPGRMEHVADEPRTIVDFAHNTEAIELAIDTLRPTTSGKLTIVFGATGERDIAKRAKMGHVAVRGADRVIITDDDPHDEDPATIREQILAGAEEQQKLERGKGREVEVIHIPSRADAIAYSVQSADIADTVLIAGRGHETVQEVAGTLNHLDDREEVRAAFTARGNRQ